MHADYLSFATSVHLSMSFVFYSFSPSPALSLSLSLSRSIGVSVHMAKNNLTCVLSLSHYRQEFGK